MEISHLHLEGGGFVTDPSLALRGFGSEVKSLTGEEEVLA